MRAMESDATAALCKFQRIIRPHGGLLQGPLPLHILKFSTSRWLALSGRYRTR